MLNSGNYHSWKIRIQHVLTLKDLEHHLEEDLPEISDDFTVSDAAVWTKRDKKAQAIIGLSLSDELLENVREVETTKDMWIAIRNVFERHTLLNKLSARKKFYTATKHSDESVLQFSNRVRQLASTLKSMNVDISESEMAMALLNGLPDEYNALISALDAIDEHETSLRFEFVKSRIIQEEQRIEMRHKSAQEKSEAAALVSRRLVELRRNGRRRPYCTHCKRHGHVESKCWTKHPHLDPRNQKPDLNPALVANQSDDDPVVCLFAKQSSAEGEEHASCFMAKYEEANEPRLSDKWFIDSGCSNHMTYNKSLFSSYTTGHHGPVELGNSNTSKVLGKGIIELAILVDGKQSKCRLNNVLFVPELGYQLLSVPIFDKSGLNTSFHSSRCWIQKENTLLATGTMKGNLYQLDVPALPIERALVSQKVWHHRLAHIQLACLIQMSKSNAVEGLEVEDTERNNMTCTGCVLGKGHRQAIPKKAYSRSTKLLELVHSDVNGPIEVPSLGGSRYFVTFIDDYSRWTTLYTMKAKSEVFNCFKQYHSYAEKHTGARIGSVNVIKRTQKTAQEVQALRTDNGGEYLSNEFKSYIMEHGIQHQLTVAYTPQQNGVAERMNRTLMDCVRSLLLTAKVDKKFWAEALSTAVYIRNRVISRSLPPNITPHHRWMGKTPNVSHLRVFGSKCWYVIPKHKLKKLDARSREGLMMGYSTQSKGYKIWDLESRKMIVSRDVTFNENLDNTAEITYDDEKSRNVTDPGGEVKDDTIDNIVFPSRDRTESQTNDQTEVQITEDGNDDSEFEDAHEESEPPLRYPSRIRKPPVRFGFIAVSPFFKALVAQEVPVSFRSATSTNNVDFWQPGIDREHECLERNSTWTLVDYKPGMKVLPCKYVFKVKGNKPKVRLVALGCRQLYGVDYNETFAPVVTMTTIRTILAVAAHHDLELEQMDVVTAFLNGDLEEDIYMAIPEGLKTNANTNKVCKLLKSLYGLKQSPRQWYFKMHQFLLQIGLTSSPNDPCLYIRHSSIGILLIALYVDDLLIAGSSPSEVKSVKDKLSHRFEMKDMGEAKVILGIEISRDRSTRRLFINQSEYTRNLLERFGMVNSNPVVTPMDKSYIEGLPVKNTPAIDVPYRQAIGSLMYLMITTRPDIAFAIGKLSQHNQNPRANDWIAVKRLLRYVNGTQNFGILYDGSKPLTIDGYSDADWGGCKTTRKSTSGSIFLIAGGAVSWRSKKQTCVATSTCEAEYIASCLACKESIWLARLLSDLENKAPQQVPIKVDNDGTIDSANNSSVNQRNKHIDLQYHFVRDAVHSNRIRLVHCASGNQLADPLTKPLDRVMLEKLRLMQGICANPLN